jgi:hypothetical protein
MPRLHEIQDAMRRALLTGADADAASHLAANRIGAAARLAVYRNNFEATLIRALRLTFPAIDRLVGTEFFDHAAASFAQRHPPASAWLDLYGGEFPTFLDAFPEAAAVPYLGDVARLEWSVSRALSAADAAPLGLDAFAACTEPDHARLRFEPHPSVGLVRAAYPADAIWRATLEGDEAAMEAIRLTDGPVHLLVQRASDGVEVTRLAEADWEFAAALLAGASLGAALAAYPEVDAPAILADLIVKGRFAGLALAPEVWEARP